MEIIAPGLYSAPNIHPMFVHFPIAFWTAAAAALLFATMRSSDQAWRLGVWLHVVGAVGAVVAASLGFWATFLSGHDGPRHDLVHVHRDFMVVASVLSLAITTVAWLKREPGTRLRWALVGASILLFGVMSLGADRGAELVYRHGIGVAAQPVVHSEGGTHEHAH